MQEVATFMMRMIQVPNVPANILPHGSGITSKPTAATHHEGSEEDEPSRKFGLPHGDDVRDPERSNHDRLGTWRVAEDVRVHHLRLRCVHVLGACGRARHWLPLRCLKQLGRVEDLRQDSRESKAGVQRTADYAEPVGQHSTRCRAAPKAGAAESHVERICGHDSPHGVHPPAGLGQLQGPVLIEVEEFAWPRDHVDRPKSFEAHVRQIEIHEAEITE